jgi:predicted transposase/invertase (TIGR01784 family)
MLCLFVPISDHTMKIPFDISRDRPHDAYFEQVFKVLPVTLELVRQFLPQEQVAVLNLSTLQLASESYLSDDLREFFSDLVYTCETFQAEPVRICLLLEHKSGSTGRRIYVQLGNYLRGVQDEDISQQRPRFTLSIPILFYHGAAPWDISPLREQYGAVPAVLSGYIPHFDIVKINVQALLDSEIRNMQGAVLLRNILLAFKHIRENEFIRHHFREVLIFVHESLSEEVLSDLFLATFLYIQIVSPLNKQDIMELVETLPPQEELKAKSVYEQFVDEGFEKGMEKGMEKLLVAFLKKNPNWTDRQVADAFDIPVGVVQNLRIILIKQG